MTYHPKQVADAAGRVIKALEPQGYEVQRDVLLVLAAYMEARKVLREAGLIEADQPEQDNLEADDRALGGPVNDNDERRER